LVVGVASLVVVLALRRWLPLLPGSLVAVLLGIAAVPVLDLQAHGVAIVGHIDSGLPHLGLPSLPQAQQWLQVVGPAVGVLLVGYAEVLGAAKTYAAREGYDVDPNRELLGMGAANLGAGLGSGMVVNGSLSKTAVNGAALIALAAARTFNRAGRSAPARRPASCCAPARAGSRAAG
jgi:MFS superfamily sulfate permease-like transporter